MRGLALLLLLPLEAHAQELPARLGVERAAGAEQCADREQLRQRVESILHRTLPTAEGSEGITIAVEFARSRSGAFEARVSATGPKPGKRELRDKGPNCDALSEAVAVAVALLLDSAQVQPSDARQEAPTPTSSVEQPPARGEPESNAPRESPTAAPATSWSGRVSLEAGGSYGLGGDGSALGAAHLGVRLGHWRVDAGLTTTLPVSSDFDGGTVRTSLLFGSARACYLVGGSFALGPCAHVGYGRLLGEGDGYGETRSASLPWLAAGLGLGAEAALGSKLYVSLGTTLWVPSDKHTFSVENAGTGWESRRVAGAATVGLGLTLF